MRDELDIPMPRMIPAGMANFRGSRSQPMLDMGTRRLAIIAGGIGGALLLLVGAWSLTGHHGGGVPVVEADSRPLRTKPDQPGGMQVNGQNDAILSGVSAEKDSMAAPPEVPAPQTLRQQADREMAAKLAAAAAPLPPVTAAIAAPEGQVPQGQVPPVAQPVSLSSAPPAPPPPVVVSAMPEQKPATAAHVAAKPMSAAAMPAGAGAGQVQLAALGTQEAAMAEWARLQHRMPDLLGNRQPAVLRFDRAGKTYFRLRTGGFANLAQATAFCEQVRTKGSGCSIAAF